LVVKSDGLSNRLGFERALELCEPSRMSLQHGLAVLSIDDVYQMCARMFKDKLLGNIARLRQSAPPDFVRSVCDEFERRIAPRAIQFVSCENVDELAKRSFPPCMKRILESLRKSSLLTFKARLELCLFLKGIVMDVWEQPAFWKASRSSGCINLATLYGFDGGVTAYSSHSCVTMASRECPKTAGQVQGCPFRVMPRSELKMHVKQLARSLPRDAVDAIAANVPNHPQVACRLFFDAVFPERAFPKPRISHPVEFFTESEKRLYKRQSGAG